MAKINKEQVSEILKSMHPKDSDDPVDKYTELLKTVSSQQGSTIDPTLMLLLGNNGSGKSMDKLYDMVAFKQVMKMLGDDGDKKDDVKDLIKAINDSTDKKLQAIQDSFSKQLEALKEAMPKPKSEESVLLEKLINKLDKAEEKGDSDEVDRLIKLITVMQPNKQEKDPLDTFSKMYDMVNTGNEKYIGLKEEMLKQQNDSTQSQLKQALTIIDNMKDNSDWMGKLQESTQTINKFKSFMEESGLKPVPQKTEGGKVDLKYILDTVSEVVKNIAPSIPPPKQNPSWNVEREAQKLYNKYKDVLGQEDGTPLTMDFVKQELQRNPNVENIWKAQIESAMKQEIENNPDMENSNSDEEIAKMFEGLSAEKKKAETVEKPKDIKEKVPEETIETEETEETEVDEKEKNNDIKPKHINGMSV